MELGAKVVHGGKIDARIFADRGMWVAPGFQALDALAGQDLRADQKSAFSRI